MNWLKKLFEKPRCDFDDCENPTHGWVHTTNAGQRYVPIKMIIREEIARIDGCRALKKNAKK